MRTVLAVSAVAALIAPALAAVPIDDIAGAWTGKGKVQQSDTAKPINVSCEVTGEQSSPTDLGFDGVCRALLVMKRPIGATFKLDGDKITGTYTGSLIGVAQLDGVATSPTEWDLKMTFPKEVNGDNIAQMTISNPGDGTFRIQTRDKMTSGVEVTTTDVTFRKS